MRQKFSLTSDEAHAIVTAAKLEAVEEQLEGQHRGGG